jgi:type II secretory pathway pseudopilin PulG
MNKLKRGFILIEAIAAVILVSICLTLIAQALLVNSRSSARFQDGVRSLMAMENKIGLLYATNGAADQMTPTLRLLEEPYKGMAIRIQTSKINDHLKKMELALQWLQGTGHRSLSATTIIYSNTGNQGM